jgi:hypothetical protein
VAPTVDLTGRKYGRLTVLSYVGGSRACRWLCQCDCGVQKPINGGSIRSGKTISCGCARVGRVTHGMSRLTEYHIWKGMIDRCSRKKNRSYSIYGGRGITVCQEWRSDFLSFFAHVGPRPTTGHSIERVDVNGNYEPGNCVWATREQQFSNMQKTIYVMLDGEKMSLSQAIRRVDPRASFSSVKYRLERGWDLRDAITLRGQQTRSDKHLTWDDVREIRGKYKAGRKGFGAIALGRLYGISQSMVQSIVKNKAWVESPTKASAGAEG